MAADMVLQWNEILLDAVRTDRTAPPIASRAMAIVHAAIYDAVNAIDRTHEVFAVDVLASPTASREAAVAAAAHATLSSLFPAQAADFETFLEASLATVPDGPAEDAGVALGVDCATQMLALRLGDGWDATVPYTPGTDPGDWQPTPAGFAPALLPQWGQVTPFAMLSGSQFSPDEIPALTSAEYAAAFAEVKELGELDSATRTDDQRNIALFWANGAGTATPSGHLNMIAHVVAEAEGNTLSENARLFAALNVAMADAAIMAWDAKFGTDFWRPVTAIRAADTDGNPDTVADSEWTPLISTPPFPTYVSGHSSFSGAAAAVLQAFFGRDDIAFTLASENPAVPDRSFTSFSHAAEESALSRLYGGIHWNFDNNDGLTAGLAVGQFVADNFFELEDRGATAGLVGGALVVFGSEGHDVLRLQQGRNQIFVFAGGRLLGSFDTSSVDSVAIHGQAGHDVIALGNNFRLSATIYGGAGNDVLIGGRADDVIFGGDGHDVLLGLLGNDLLDGEDGRDVEIGGPGQAPVQTAARGRRR
jgi:hypothetical protein